MSRQQSESRPRSKPAEAARQPTEAKREERSRHADVGLAPGQDEDPEIDESRDIEEGPSGVNPAPRVEPSREDGPSDQRSRQTQPKNQNKRKRDDAKKPGAERR